MEQDFMIKDFHVSEKGHVLGNRSESGRQAPVSLGVRDPAQCLIQRPTASGVRPSIECFRRTAASAPPAGISPGTKKFFCKNVFHTKATPFMGRTIFGQVFVREGMTEISK
jgi:hypothetical protein